MKVLDQALVAAVTVAMLTARSDAAPLPSFRSIEISRYAPHAARDLPTQLLPLGFHFNGWIRSTMLGNGHGCDHGPIGCSNGGKPGGTPPHPLATPTDTDKRAPAPDRHAPIEDCAQSPTGCQGNGAPSDATVHVTGETGEGMPFLGGGCSHSPTGCASAMPSDPDIGIRGEHFTTLKPHLQPPFCSSPGGCAPPPGGGTHGKKRDVIDNEDEATSLAARGKGNGGCAHSPTGCGPPGGGGAHPPHSEHPRRDLEEHQEEERSPTADADSEELAARGKGNGGCAHSPTGCGPPGGGGAHPPHNEHPRRDLEEHQEEKRTSTVDADSEELAARGKGSCAHSPTGCGPPGNGGGPPAHPEHPRRDLAQAQIQERATTLAGAPHDAAAMLAARGKGNGGCAHSPTGCGPPGNGGAHPPHPVHPKEQKRDIDILQQEERELTTGLNTTLRGKPGRSCGHSPTGCPPPPGNGGPNPGHGKRTAVDVDVEEAQAHTQTLAPALAERSRFRGECGMSPTGCIAPPNSGSHGGGGRQKEKREAAPVEITAEDETTETGALAALTARGKSRGGCNHSPTGCPPGGGGPHVHK